MSASNRSEPDGSSPLGTSAVKMGSWLSAIGAGPSKGIAHVHLMITVILGAPTRSSQSMVPVTNWSCESTLGPGTFADRESAPENCFWPTVLCGDLAVPGEIGTSATTVPTVVEPARFPGGAAGATSSGS